MTEFQDEGGFLLSAERAADALERRLRAANEHIKAFRLTRDELTALSQAFARSVAIARAYHLASAVRKDEAA